MAPTMGGARHQPTDSSAVCLHQLGNHPLPARPSVKPGIPQLSLRLSLLSRKPIIALTHVHGVLSVGVQCAAEVCGGGSMYLVLLGAGQRLAEVHGATFLLCSATVSGAVVMSCRV